MLLLHNTPEYASALKNAYRQFPAKDSTLDIDFINNRNRVAGIYGAALDGVTFTRSTTGTYFDATGTMQTAAVNEPRFEYDPVSLRPLGLVFEESRANQIRNNTMLGAVAGTPGTLPTNWLKAERVGITFSCVGSGIINGINYVDIKISGTATGTSGSSVQFEQNSVVSANNGQTWTLSAYVQLIDGSISGLSNILLGWEERTTGFLQSQQGVISIKSTGLLSESRVFFTGTNSNASTTSIKPYINVNPINGSVVNLTLRIGLPQLELGAFATSAIPTTGTAATRGADVASMTGANFSNWYNASEGSVLIIFDTKTALGKISYPISIHNGTDNEIIAPGRLNGSAMSFRVITGGVTQADIAYASSYVSNVLMKTAAGYKQDDFAAAYLGMPFGVDTAGNVPSANAMSIGDHRTTGLAMNGHIARLAYYPKRLPNNLLQYLSRLTA